MLPALLAHGHTVVAYVRSENKLRSLITARLAERITIHTGDALDSNGVEAALREHGCNAISTLHLSRIASPSPDQIQRVELDHATSG